MARCRHATTAPRCPPHPTASPVARSDARNAEARGTIGPVPQLQGRLPPRVLALIVAWALRHQEELFANWHRLREGLPARPIAPLE